MAGAPSGTESTPLLSSFPPLISRTSEASNSNTIPPSSTNDVNLGVDNSWKEESKLLVSYSLPLITTYLLQYLYNLVTIFVAGHIGTDALAGVSLGITTMNIVGFAIFEGMATSLDTLCAQAYGSGNPKMVGVHVQRMVLFMLVITIPIGALWICSPWILDLIVPQKNLPVLAGSFLRYSLIGVPGYATFEAGKRFLQAQGNFTAGLVILIVCAPVNILLNWLFVFHLDLGVPGAALAAAITNDLRPILLILYIRFMIPWTLECWPGLLPKSVFHNWRPMIILSIPGTLMSLCEWMSWEILTFSTSYLSTLHLAAQTILTTISLTVWHVSFSAGISVSTRIGQLIGSGAVIAARNLSKFYIIVFTLLGVFQGGIILALSPVLPRIFTQDPELQNLISQILPLVALFQFFDAGVSGAHGVLRGLGRQAIGGWVTLLANYTYAVPLALVLELVVTPSWGLLGLWSALASCLAIVATVEGLWLCFMDWRGAVEEARKREEREDGIGGEE